MLSRSTLNPKFKLGEISLQFPISEIIFGIYNDLAKLCFTSSFAPSKMKFENMQLLTILNHIYQRPNLCDTLPNSYLHVIWIKVYKGIRTPIVYAQTSGPNWLSSSKFMIHIE